MTYREMANRFMDAFLWGLGVAATVAFIAIMAGGAIGVFLGSILHAMRLVRGDG